MPIDEYEKDLSQDHRKRQVLEGEEGLRQVRLKWKGEG